MNFGFFAFVHFLKGAQEGFAVLKVRVRISDVKKNAEVGMSNAE